MQQIFDIPPHLKLRLVHNESIDSNGYPPTAVFQFVAEGADEFLIKINDVCCIQFAAFYKYENHMYEHPFTLFTNSNNNPIFQFYEKRSYNIPLFLKLKRLRDFNENDWKIYYQTIDENLGVSVDFSDFHDVYLKIYYYRNNNTQWSEYLCNDGQPIHLPKFISNPWTQTNTLFRFRYDAENRDDSFPCRMQLIHHDIAHINSYKIVLCLTTNTIPARMDYHSIRWICKLKTRANRQRGKSKTGVDKENVRHLNHSTGVVVAQISGSDLTFTPQIYSGPIKSCYEPVDFTEELQKSDVKDHGGLAVAVIKENEYPNIVKSRRRDETIRQYIPFNELDEMDNNLEGGVGEIIRRLKRYKRECYGQLTLNDQTSKKTYSQAHVRLYVAAYDENNVLLTETLHPPFRDSKKFEQLQMIKIVQPKFELHSGDKAFIYCIYDSDKLKPGLRLCPYIIELAFSAIYDKPDDDHLLEMFEKQQIHIQALYVEKCPNLLEFQIPHEPLYDKHRVFIRLQHKSSLDYNPSESALTNNESWIYYADTNVVNDDSVADMINQTDTLENIEYYTNLYTPRLQLQTP